MGVRIPWAGGLLAGVLFLAVPAVSQLQVGDNLNLNLNGTLAGGYTGDYGNLISSSHSLSGSGTGTLSGFYYNPNFLSFNVTPYYGQSRANSNYQSIFDSSGVNVSTSIFSGSHFPGSVSYAKSYNSEGNFGVPGVADYTTRGNSDTFGITWSENLPDEPSLSASFQRGSNDYSIFGTDQNGDSTFHSLTLRSGYLFHGFGLGAFYQDGGSHSLIPQLTETQEPPEDVSSSSSGYGFNVTHALPMRGGFSANFNRSSFDTGLLGSSYSGNIDTITSNAGIQPTDKLHLAVGANYSNSLTGQLYEQVVAAGGAVPAENINQSSHGLDIIGTMGYALARGLQSEVDIERREQTFLGETFGANTYSGSLLYTTGFLGGNFNGAATIRDSTLDNTNENTLGFTTSASFTRRINAWVMTGSFSYAQNAQTLLITYNSSFYNYSGNVRHRWGPLTWNAGVSAGHSGLTIQQGTKNSSESYTTGLGISHFITATGTYSKSSGIGIETTSGVAQNPVLEPVVTPSALILFGGDSYGIGLGSSPVRRLTIAASYARANSNTSFDSVASKAMNTQYNTFFQYQFRKMYLTGGFSRLQQGFNTTGTVPAVVSSFYVGVSRWFNFF
ncbi:MAG TPA: hypothetical protein VMU61_11840 [Candidatus Aquilonibacter sp.]|nr:hypothetical protein [Candidatus Aquilonibacter sp.]